MTDVPSPPFALPLRFEEETDPDISTPGFGWIWDADGATITLYPVYKPMALAIIRAVNGYAKMREFVERFASGYPPGPAEALLEARTILKEIDNG